MTATSIALRAGLIALGCLAGAAAGGAEDAATARSSVTDYTGLSLATSVLQYSDTFFVRGFDLGSLTLYRRDGLTTPNYSTTLPYENLERVEVLKGISALARGFWSPDGVVNLVAKRPTDTPFATLRYSVNPFGQRLPHLDFGSTLGDAVGYRINLAEEENGLVYQPHSYKRTLVSAAFDIKLADRLKLELDLDRHHQSYTPPLNIEAVNGVVPARVDRTLLLAQPWAQYSDEQTNVGARLSWQLDADWRMTLGRQAARPRDNDDYWSSSGLNAAGSGQFTRDWRVGAWYRSDFSRLALEGGDNWLGVRHHVELGIDRLDVSAQGGGYAHQQYASSIYAPVQLLPSAFANTPFGPTSLYSFSETALPVRDTISLTPGWELLLGARPVRFQGQQAFLGAVSPQEKFVVTPSVALIHQAAPGLSLFASGQRNLEPPGVAPVYAANAGQLLAPPTTEQHEIGLKLNPSAAMTYTAALFEVKRTLAFLDASNVFRQDGKQQHRGIEVAATGTPAKYWTASFSATMTRAEVVQTIDPTLIGRRPENVPHLQFTASGERRIENVEGLSANFTLTGQSRRFTDAGNTAQIAGYMRLDAGITYDLKFVGHAMSVKAGIENLTDKFYWASAKSGLIQPGPPRTARVQAQLEF